MKNNNFANNQWPKWFQFDRFIICLYISLQFFFVYCTQYSTRPHHLLRISQIIKNKYQTRQYDTVYRKWGVRKGSTMTSKGETERKGFLPLFEFPFSKRFPWHIFSIVFKKYEHAIELSLKIV